MDTIGAFVEYYLPFCTFTSFGTSHFINHIMKLVHNIHFTWPMLYVVFLVEHLLEIQIN